MNKKPCNTFNIFSQQKLAKQTSSDLYQFYFKL